MVCCKNSPHDPHCLIRSCLEAEVTCGHYVIFGGFCDLSWWFDDALQGYDHGYYFISTFIGEHIAYHAKFLSP